MSFLDWVTTRYLLYYFDLLAFKWRTLHNLSEISSVLTDCTRLVLALSQSVCFVTTLCYITGLLLFPVHKT